MEQNLHLKFNTLNQDEVNIALYYACKKGNLDEVNYLLTSPDLTYHSDIHYENDEALHTSYFYGHLEITKYLLSSPKLNEHADIHSRDDQMFVFCYGNYIEQDYAEFLNFLIFDLNITKTPRIKKYMEEYNSQEFKKAFDIRDLNKELDFSSTKKDNNPKVKI